MGGWRRPAAILLVVLWTATLAGCDRDTPATVDPNGSADGSGASDTAADAEPSGWPIDQPPADAEVVDRDLVARVVAELDIHVGDLYAAVGREGEVGELAEALARSIYTEAAVPDVLARVEDHRDLLRDTVATPRSAIVEVATATTSCVDALVRRDLGPMLTLDEDDAIETWQVTLLVVDDSDNGTTWRMDRDTPGDQAPSGCG